jgi:hypothetical protein
MDLVLPLFRRHLVGKRTPSPESTVPLIAAGADETRQSDLPNRTIQFAQLQAGDSISCSFCVQTPPKLYNCDTLSMGSILCMNVTGNHLYAKFLLQLHVASKEIIMCCIYNHLYI